MTQTTPPPANRTKPAPTGQATTTTTKATAPKTIDCSQWAAFCPLPGPPLARLKAATVAAVAVLALLLLTGCDLVMFSEVTYSTQASDNATAVQVVGNNNTTQAGDLAPAAVAGPAAYTGRPASDWAGLLLMFFLAGLVIVACFFIMRPAPPAPFTGKEKQPYW